MTASQKQINPVSGGNLELLDIRTPPLGLKSDPIACKTREMGAIERANVTDVLTSKLRSSMLEASHWVTNKSAIRTSLEEEGSTKTAGEPTPCPEMSILTTTPPESVQGRRTLSSPLNPKADEYSPKRAAAGSVYIEEPRDEVRHMMWLYSSQLAKECKGQCPLAKKGKCKCQSNADKVLGDLDILSGDTPLDEDDKVWYRFFGNMITMLNFFWSEHGIDHPLRDFDLGYYGFKLLQAFKKEEFKMERAIFETIFEVQFRGPLDEILAEEMMQYYIRIEQMLARELGANCILADDTYSN